jgi:hypothetical protein
MFTNRTCGRCYRLHVRLGSSDVFHLSALREPRWSGREHRSQYLALCMRWITASLQVSLHIFYRTTAGGSNVVVVNSL